NGTIVHAYKRRSVFIERYEDFEETLPLNLRRSVLKLLSRGPTSNSRTAFADKRQRVL
ncbi:uncharacterized protein PHACADRAFT_105570, partial [Phanerochaete carnosa HHB-10118-sp]